MIDIKRDIILTEGTEMEIIPVSGTPSLTTALVGRASKQFDSSVSLETHRRGQFLPEAAVKTGDVLRHTVASESYLVISTLNEIIQNEVAAIVAHMFICNSAITVSGVTETLTPRGDVKKVDAVKFADLICYSSSKSARLHQKDPGVLIENDYTIYAPATTPISTLDKLRLTAGTTAVPLKVIDTDYITYPGLVVIEACVETRK
ncbi:hypothetical protein ACP26L_36390 (plasmid) [Paenibacillus sp. S-38]|uniref:hypothetical protein n=1 Tax=Paenibacillus sp. S-38 TaxID=3416710 RepID=UPI003CF787F5